MSTEYRFGQRYVKSLSLLPLMFLLLVLAPLKITYAANKASITSNQYNSDSTSNREVISTETYRNKRLLQKTIHDLDSFRVMLKYINDHNDDNSRLLLQEETGKYISNYVDPLLENKEIYNNSETLKMAIILTFFKAYVKFETGEHEEYSRIINDMGKKYGEKHLNISISPFTENFKTIGEGIMLLGERIP